MPVAGLFLLVIACGWALVGGIRASAAESHWAKALAAEKRLAEEGWQGTDQDYAELIAHAAAAADAEPDRIEYIHWLNVYRLQDINRNLDPQTGTVLLSPESLAMIRRITAEFHAARVLCPTFGPTYCIVGQLELSYLGNPRGAELIRTGHMLYPAHPTTCFVVGRLDAQEGRFEASLNHFRRSILLGHPIAEPLAIYVNDLNRPDLALELARGNSAGLLALAALLEAKPGHAELAAAAREQAIGLLRADADRPGAAPATLATLAGLMARQQDHPAAVAYYQRALDLDYGNVQWRLALAQALAAAGQVPQAIHEARICLRLRPQFAAAERLIAEWSVRPAASPAEAPKRRNDEATKGKAAAGGGAIPADRN
jgi:tetratricopeptide (TPR) repeat protein